MQRGESGGFLRYGVWWEGMGCLEEMAGGMLGGNGRWDAWRKWRVGCLEEMAGCVIWGYVLM